MVGKIRSYMKTLTVGVRPGHMQRRISNLVSFTNGQISMEQYLALLLEFEGKQTKHRYQVERSQTRKHVRLQLG
jgi:hypothetical protein